MNIEDLIAEVRADTEVLTAARDRGDFDPFTAEGAVLLEALADAAPLLADEVERLTGELDSTYQLLRETLFAGPLVTGRTADSLRVRDRLLGWVFTSFAAELERSTAPNNLSISMTPDEDHPYSGYRLDLTIARPEHVSTHEQNDALRAEVERLTAANEELRLTLAAEQGHAEGAPSGRWRYGYTNQGHAWVLPYLDADLPAEYRGRDWTGSSTDHDPICRTYRLFNGKWALWWRLGRRELTVHDTARAAMLAAKEGA